jgi:hypothetical protein
MIHAGTIRPARAHLLRLRRILDQLHELVAQDHLARRHREVLPDLELLESRRSLPLERPLHILGEMAQPAQQVAAVLVERLLDELRVRRQVVVRRQHLEAFAHHERHQVLRTRLGPRHVAERVARPVGDREKALRVEVVREAAPLVGREAARVGEPLVAGKGC